MQNSSAPQYTIMYKTDICNTESKETDFKETLYSSATQNQRKSSYNSEFNISLSPTQSQELELQKSSALEVRHGVTHDSYFRMPFSHVNSCSCSGLTPHKTAPVPLHTLLPTMLHRPLVSSSRTI